MKVFGGLGSCTSALLTPHIQITVTCIQFQLTKSCPVFLFSQTILDLKHKPMLSKQKQIVLNFNVLCVKMLAKFMSNLISQNKWCFHSGNNPTLTGNILKVLNISLTRRLLSATCCKSCSNSSSQCSNTVFKLAAVWCMTGAKTESSHYTHCVALLFLRGSGLAGLMRDVVACVPKRKWVFQVKYRTEKPRIPRKEQVIRILMGKLSHSWWVK